MLSPIKYGRTLSQESYEGLELADVERKNAEHNIKVRRRAVICAIATIFSVTTIIMVMSVLHVEMNKFNGYEELICQETDKECLELLCPQGWEWIKEKGECEILEGEWMNGAT